MFGVPDDEYGERLFACIEPDANAALSPATVQEFLRGRLANFKVPKDIQFLDAMPREATVKNSSASCATSMPKAGCARLKCSNSRVMAGLVPAIHVLPGERKSKSWMAGSSLAMTKIRDCPLSRHCERSEAIHLSN